MTWPPNTSLIIILFTKKCITCYYFFWEMTVMNTTKAYAGCAQEFISKPLQEPGVWLHPYFTCRK